MTDTPAATLDARLDAAVGTYVARLTRQAQPDGHWQTNGVKAWYPSDNERRHCCRLHQPSLRNEQVLLLHCRGLKHVAALHGVPLPALRQAIRNRHTTPTR